MEAAVRSSPNEREAAAAAKGGRGEEGNALIFLDSLDSYITLLDSLSSTLRQILSETEILPLSMESDFGWLDLASARQSMGSSCISNALFDLKVQSAATTLQVTKSIDGSLSMSEPHYTLSKWASLREEKCSSRVVAVGELQKKSESSQLRHRGLSHLPEGVQETAANGSLITVDSNVQWERSKSLTVFGTLVSPKLRSAQVSFETALETIVEIANIRSLVLSAFSQLQKEKQGSD